MIGHQGRSNATPCSSGGPKQTDGTAEIPEGGSSLRTVTKVVGDPQSTLDELEEDKILQLVCNLAILLPVVVQVTL